MGEVYLAYDTNLHRLVAIKLLPADLTQNKVSFRRFKREAYAASSLNHPNIVTIYEIGEDDGCHFIAMEYVEGENLRQHTSHTRMEIRDVLNVTSQVASALAVAHQAKIVHRDIKLENIMLRPDGLVKVLDFGLAKLMDANTSEIEEQTHSEALTRMKVSLTEPGVLIGTVSYMSPEQARGEKLDERTDLWSVGVVTYELVAGRMPFEGKTTTDVITKILYREPPSLLLYGLEVPPELERIVEKALAKDREERYQLAKELKVDLNRLKQHLEVEAELERSETPEESSQARERAAMSRGAAAAAAASGSGKSSASGIGASSASSAATSADWSASGKNILGLILALLVVAAVAVVTFNRRPNVKLTDKDPILLLEFVNPTGDPVFNDSLKVGLAKQLDQSPSFDILPDPRAREGLRLMGRPSDIRITEDLALEICQRLGLKAFVAGSIVNHGSTYVITLQAINGQTGGVLARVQHQASSKEQVLNTLTRAATELRRQLGESLHSVQTFNVPLELTTKSLDALKDFSQGYQLSLQGKGSEAIPYYRHALTYDDEFAYAYSGLAVEYKNSKQPELAAENAKKAYALIDRVSKLEKYRISYFYHSYVTGDVDEAIKGLTEYKETFPHDHRAPTNLSDRYLAIGQYERAVQEARDALALNQESAIASANLGLALMGLNKFGEARKVYEDALKKAKDARSIRISLYQVAFIEPADRVLMEEQIKWLREKREEYIAEDLPAQSAAFNGQWQQAREFSGRAVEVAKQNNVKEIAARYSAEQGLREAMAGQCRQTLSGVAKAREFAENKLSLTASALALGLCGHASQAQTLVHELKTKFPADTLIKSLWLPTIIAAIEIGRGNYSLALKSLDDDGVRRYEAAAEFWPQYLRGQAYLHLPQQGAKAAYEFKKILEHRGQTPLSPLYRLAYLGLARATALTGDTGQSLRSYQEFLSLWKDADPDALPYREAQREYEKLSK
jgi:serine/threonine protein kinase/predicted Zn-dependent protease